MSRLTGSPNLITFDMGGTSCDVALIRDGEPSVASRGKIDGRDIALPMLDINTVSAGGGTIARVDRFGVLAVGPQSAGAVPGPACYGRGGTLPTITDCNLVLGRLSADNFLGGRMRLDAGLARRAIAEHVARPLSLGIEAAAEGVIRIIDVKMQEAIKAISTMRGHDLRDFVLLAFGGGGPLHAGQIARDLGMAGIVVPLYPGVYSAMGLLLSDVKHDYVQSRMAPIDHVSPQDVERMFGRLEARAREGLARDGFAPDRVRLQRALDMRYAGQGYEITVACEPGPVEASPLAGLRARFDRQHQAMFGHMAPEETVEIVSYRVRGTGLTPPVEMERFAPAGTSLCDAERERRRVRFGREDIDCPVYQRERIDVGLSVQGPAVLDQFDCTTVILPGQVARIDEWKNLIVGEDR
jgi:N-methylhydantoinase A